LRKQVEKLEGAQVEPLQHGWESLLVPFLDDTGAQYPVSMPIRGSVRIQGKGLVIDCPLHYTCYLPQYIWNELEGRDDIEEVYSTSIVVRLGLGAQDLADVDMFWRRYLSKDEASIRDIVGGRADGDGIVRRKRYSGRDEDGVSSELDTAIERLFEKRFENTLGLELKREETVSMLCRLSYKMGSYMRIHLSKGWSQYLLRNYQGDITAERLDFDVFGFNPDERMDELIIPMRCQYTKGGDGLRVKLPSWFQHLDRGSFNVRRSFIGKVKRVFTEETDDDDKPNSWMMGAGISAHWNKRKGRNELRCVGGEFTDYELPTAGILDIELQL